MDQKHANEFLNSLTTSPALFPEEIDFENRVVTFCRMAPDSYARSAFLDDRKFRADGHTYKVRLDYLLNKFGSCASNPAAINWIFHTPHSGSTLIARALDELNGCFALKEPTLLIQASSVKRHPKFNQWKQSGDWERFLTMVLELLSRTFNNTETALIKTTSVCHNLVNDIFSCDRTSRGLFLYSSLEKYLISLYKRDYLDAYLNAGFMKAVHDISMLDLMDIQDAEKLPRNRKVAVLWLSIVLNLNNYLMGNPDKIILSIDCNQFFSERCNTLQALAEHFGYTSDQDSIETIVNGPIFTRDAKSESTTWNENAYSDKNITTRKHFSTEIEDALIWAEELVNDAGHSFPVPIGTLSA